MGNNIMSSKAIVISLKKKNIHIETYEMPIKVNAKQ